MENSRSSSLITWWSILYPRMGLAKNQCYFVLFSTEKSPFSVQNGQKRTRRYRAVRRGFVTFIRNEKAEQDFIHVD